MGYKSGIVTSETVSIQHDLDFELAFQITELSQLTDTSSKIFYRAKETLGFHWFVYIATCLVFSAITSYCYGQSIQHSGIGQFMHFFIVFSFPLYPVSVILLAKGWMEQLIITAIIFFIYVICLYISWASLANNKTTYWNALLSLTYFNFVPLVLILLCRIKWIRAAGLFVLSFFVITLSGPAILFYYTNNHLSFFENWTNRFDNNGTLIIWLLLSTLIVIILAWITLKGIKYLYINKWINDMQLNADACLLLFNITYAVFIYSNSPLYALISFTAFPAYKISGYILFYFLRKRKLKQVSPRLLLLRVFALGDASRYLFERVLKHWRYAGSIQMISGPDLATTTIEPHEIISYVRGKLKNSFCEDEESIKQNISRADILPDMDGTHRVNEFFCRDDNWKEVLKKLVSQSDVVFMDLRSFSEKFKGCQYEIEALVNLVSLDKLVFMIDDKTDILFTKTVFVKAFQLAGNNSANSSVQQPVIFYKIKNNRHKDVFNLLNLLCLKVEVS